MELHWDKLTHFILVIRCGIIRERTERIMNTELMAPRKNKRSRCRKNLQRFCDVNLNCKQSIETYERIY